jgi:hypothetical protein
MEAAQEIALDGGRVVRHAIALRAEVLHIPEDLVRAWTRAVPARVTVSMFISERTMSRDVRRKPLVLYALHPEWRAGLCSAARWAHLRPHSGRKRKECDEGAGEHGGCHGWADVRARRGAQTDATVRARLLRPGAVRSSTSA